MSTGRAGTPAVSVCVPLYCKEDFIAETVRSVLDQTFTDFELVILENASTDRSADVVRTFDDPRIVFVQNPTTLDPIDNFNRSVELSTAPLVKVLCADDLLYPQCLERQVAEMNADPGLAMVTCRHDVIDEVGRLLAPDRALRTRDLIGQQGRAAVLRRLVRHGGNPVGNPQNVLFRRSAFDAAGGFPQDEDFFTVELSLWLKLLEHGGYLGLPQTLVGFRINSGSDSKRLGQRVNTISKEFVDRLCRENPGIVRRRDRAFSALREPLTRLRHHMLIAAAGHEQSAITRLSRRILSASRAVPAPKA